MPTTYNKVVAGNQTLIDLSQDTVTDASHIVAGHTGHLADGTQVAGTGGGGTYQAKTNISPTESSQTIQPDYGYDALSSVQINAVSSSYVGSGITRRDSTDLGASTLTVTAPAGYYAAQATKTLTDANLVAGNIKKDIVIFGTTGTYEGSGGSGDYTEIGSKEFTVNTSSTSATSVGTIDVANYANANNLKDVMFFIQTIDKAGSRNNYYYCTETLCVNTMQTSHSFSYITTRNSNGTLSSVNQMYGVYCSGLSTSGSGASKILTFTMTARYNSTYSKTINGTFLVKVYELKWPSNRNPFA